MPTPPRLPAAASKGRPFRLTAYVPTEQNLHEAVSQFLDVALPKTAVHFPVDYSVMSAALTSVLTAQSGWTGMPRGMLASLAKKVSALIGAMLNRRGGKPGIPDHLILLPGPAILMELKRPIGGVLSEEQERMHALIRAAGHKVFVARSIEEVRAGLLALGVPLSARISA